MSQYMGSIERCLNRYLSRYIKNTADRFWFCVGFWHCINYIATNNDNHIDISIVLIEYMHSPMCGIDLTTIELISIVILCDFYWNDDDLMTSLFTILIVSRQISVFMLTNQLDTLFIWIFQLLIAIWHCLDCYPMRYLMNKMKLDRICFVVFWLWYQ